MPEVMRLWSVGGDGKLSQLQQGRLDLEKRLEGWLAEDISVLSPDLLVIGRQVTTEHGGIIDLLCLNREGDLVIVELKRDKTPREITAQVLDYASWVSALTFDEIEEIAEKQFGDKTSLDGAFRRRFGNDLPDALNSSHSMLIVGSLVDEKSERIIRYLSDTYGVPINAATFQYFGEGDAEFVGRVFLVEPDEAPQAPGRRRWKVPVETVISQLEDEQYRAAVESIVATARDAGMKVVPGQQGFSVRCPVANRPKPISVAWFFPPGVSGWVGLKDLTLGRELAPGLAFTSEQQAVLEQFRETVAAMPGAEQAPNQGLGGVIFRPDAVKAQVPAICEALRAVADQLSALV